MQSRLEHIDSMGMGVGCVLAGALLWGFSGTCAQCLFADYGIDPFYLAFLRMSGAGLLYFLLLFFKQRDTLKELFADKPSLLRIAFFGCFGLFLSQITYLNAIRYTNSGTATVLQSSSIVMIMLIGCLVERRKPQLREVIGLVFALSAVFLIATKAQSFSLNIPAKGLAWGLISALSAVIYTLMPRKLFKQWGSVPVVGLGTIFGILPAAFCHFASNSTVCHLDLRAIFLLLIIILLGTFAAFGLFLHGVSLIGAVKASLLAAIEPVSASFFASVWMGTVFAGADWLGLILMISTTFLLCMPSGSDSSELVPPEER